MWVCGWIKGRMGILVICSYKPKAGREAEAQRLMARHVPILRQHGLVSERAIVQGAGKNGELVEIFEWLSEEKSRAAPAIAEIGNHWKAMTDAMTFVALASLPESQNPFAHFTPLA
jgi:hypothetical protein